mmetsp:Transcript_5536/g.21829  ORF Transcript_5536/g.21829 Transcript_5536/m.21829 type:complete len:211 (+) Transcript_5536:3143-3775(+)
MQCRRAHRHRQQRLMAPGCATARRGPASRKPRAHPPARRLRPRARRARPNKSLTWPHPAPTATPTATTVRSECRDHDQQPPPERPSTTGLRAPRLLSVRRGVPERAPPRSRGVRGRIGRGLPTMLLWQPPMMPTAPCQARSCSARAVRKEARHASRLRLKATTTCRSSSSRTRIWPRTSACCSPVAARRRDRGRRAQALCQRWQGHWNKK